MTSHKIYSFPYKDSLLNNDLTLMQPLSKAKYKLLRKLETFFPTSILEKYTHFLLDKRPTKLLEGSEIVRHFRHCACGNFLVLRLFSSKIYTRGSQQHPCTHSLSPQYCNLTLSFEGRPVFHRESFFWSRILVLRHSIGPCFTSVSSFSCVTWQSNMSALSKIPCEKSQTKAGRRRVSACNDAHAVTIQQISRSRLDINIVLGSRIVPVHRLSYRGICP